MKIFKLLRALNILVSILIAILAFFIIIRPVLPEIILALSYNEFQGYTYQSEKTFDKFGEIAKELPQIPQTNKLVIPRIYVNVEIIEGTEVEALNLGMWRRPNTSTPDKGSNTVITGHRFLYTSGENTFYHLDKVEKEDEVLVYWEGKEYVYRVYDISEVFPNQIEIEDPTIESIITLYTCTPLWTSEKRLVVKAKLV